MSTKRRTDVPKPLPSVVKGDLVLHKETLIIYRVLNSWLHTRTYLEEINGKTRGRAMFQDAGGLWVYTTCGRTFSGSDIIGPIASSSEKALRSAMLKACRTFKVVRNAKEVHHLNEAVAWSRHGGAIPKEYAKEAKRMSKTTSAT